MRTFRWEDLGALALLLREVEPPEAPPASRLELLRPWLELTGADPESNLFLAEDRRRGILLGFALATIEAVIERAVVVGGVRPGERGRGVGRGLVDAALRRAAEQGVGRVHAPAAESNTAAVRFLGQAGFSPVRRYWRMRREGTALNPPADAPGLSIAGVREGDPPRHARDEEEMLARLQNAAFEGSWGFAPNSPEEVARRLRLPGCAPEGVRVVWQGEEPVAYCWTRVEAAAQEAGERGIVWMIGVLPSHRGRGLGRVALEAGMRYLAGRGVRAVELSVDEANTGARRLYFSEGFRDVASTRWFERRP